jgi:hypothetical protein
MSALPIVSNPETLATASNPKLLHVFYSHIPSVRYGFRDGTFADFIKGRYYTDNEIYIAELQNEVKLRHPTLFIKAGAETIMSDDLDPNAVLRKNARRELMFEMLQALDPSRDLCQYTQGKLNAQSTLDMASLAAGGDSTQANVKLRQLLEQSLGLPATVTSAGADVSKVAPGTQAPSASIKVGSVSK